MMRASIRRKRGKEKSGEGRWLRNKHGSAKCAQQEFGSSTFQSSASAFHLRARKNKHNEEEFPPCSMGNFLILMRSIMLCLWRLEGLKRIMKLHRTNCYPIITFSRKKLKFCHFGCRYYSVAAVLMADFFTIYYLCRSAVGRFPFLGCRWWKK